MGQSLFLLYFFLLFSIPSFAPRAPSPTSLWIKGCIQSCYATG